MSFGSIASEHQETTNKTAPLTMFTLTLHMNKEQRQLNCSFDYSMKDSKESLIKKGMTLD